MGTAPRRRRKRCRFCKNLFWPDRRVAKWQRACSKVECQRERRRETQQRWRERNPSDAAARRFMAQIAALEPTDDEPAPKPVLPANRPAAMAAFPWLEVRDELSPEVFVSLVFLARLVLRSAKDEMLAHHVEIKQISGQLDAGPGRDERLVHPAETKQGFGQLGARRAGDQMESRAPPDLASPA